MSNAHDRQEVEKLWSGEFDNPYDGDELEPIEQGLEPEYLQVYLERCYSVYLTNCSSLIQQRGQEDESPSDFILGRKLHEVGMRK